MSKALFKSSLRSFRLLYTLAAVSIISLCLAKALLLKAQVSLQAKYMCKMSLFVIWLLEKAACAVGRFVPHPAFGHPLSFREKANLYTSFVIVSRCSSTTFGFSHTQRGNAELGLEHD